MNYRIVCLYESTWGHGVPCTFLLWNKSWFYFQTFRTPYSRRNSRPLVSVDRFLQLRYKRLRLNSPAPGIFISLVLIISLFSGVAHVCRIYSAGCVGAESPSTEKSIGVRQVWRHLQEGGDRSRMCWGKSNLSCGEMSFWLVDDIIMTEADILLSFILLGLGNRLVAMPDLGEDHQPHAKHQPNILSHIFPRRQSK